jgi:hypothetical protein
MSEIMTMCPVTGRSIPTGLTTNSVSRLWPTTTASVSKWSA